MVTAPLRSNSVQAMFRRANGGGNGFIITTINTVIWMTIGMAWWKVIGMY